MSVTTIKPLGEQLLVSGDIDFSTVVSLRTDGENYIQRMTKIIFDFTQVMQANSAGLTLMLSWLRCAKQLNKNIEFRNVPISLITMAKVCDLTAILRIKDHG